MSFSKINISMSFPSTRVRTTQFFSVGSICTSLARFLIQACKITSISSKMEDASCCSSTELIEFSSSLIFFTNPFTLSLSSTLKRYDSICFLVQLPF